MDLIKKFAKIFSVYFLGKALSFVVSFVMLKVYTSNISTSGYGYYELVNSYIYLAIPVCFIEIWSGMLWRVLFHSDDKQKSKVISTTISILFVSLPIYSVGYWVVYSLIKFKSPVLIFVYSLTYLFYSFSCIMARALGKNKLFAVSGILGSLANAAAGFFSIYCLHLNYKALFLSLIVNYTVQILMIFFSAKAWRYIRFSLFSKYEAKRLIGFCWPLQLNNIVNFAYTGLYKTIVNAKLGTDVLGLYTVSIKFATIITFIGSVFHLAWQEISYSITKDNNKLEVFNSALKMFGGFMMAGCAVILPAIKIMFPIFIGKEFQSAAYISPYYYLYVFFFMVNGFIYNIMSAEDKNKMLFVGKLIGTAVLITTLYLTIGTLGVISIPISTVLASVVEYVFLRIYTTKAIGMHYENVSLISVFILYLAGTAVYVWGNILINAVWLVAAGCISLLIIYKNNESLISPIIKKIKKHKA